MNLSAAFALIAMKLLPDRDEAQHWARVAARCGASPSELADAWADWERTHQPVAVAR